MYLVTVLGNLLIIMAVSSGSHLHTPMYFFLSNLSFADIGFTSSTIPKLIVDILNHISVISYVGCLIQMSVFILFGCMDNTLLTLMAYDRFVAICHPLHYSTIMNPRLCVLFLLLSVFVGLLVSQLHNLIALQFTCFKDVKIASFFCDPSHLLNLSCSDTIIITIVLYIFGTIFGLVPMSGTVFSYYKIISTVMKIPSLGGRYKAFSTCGSHLSVVCLFYGTCFGTYLGSTVSYSPSTGEVASLMYTVVTPMLNPFIYSLRNRDILNSLKMLCSWTVQSQDLFSSNIETENLTQISKFHLLGFSEDPDLQPVLFGLFLSMYLNLTQISKFHLLGFSEDPDLQPVLFGLFLSILLDNLLHNLIVLQFTYFKDVVISNFFCSPAQLPDPGCSDNFFTNIGKYVAGVLFGFFLIAGIFLSYCKVISSILRISSPGGKLKPSPPVGLTCELFSYFMEQELTGVYFSSAVSRLPQIVERPQSFTPWSPHCKIRSSTV
ncbi:olfactory receptor 18 [Fukomys damarensis]|uniref:olfactory receptor 18 n=1 Tax=Fukomys damarensis TaxID=885580 RepID=UPI001455B0A3|nr:olfactory receptor 18 [Fukomys damarensis]